ncbi:hypothetical protein GCM10022393_25540 [Aquimarina addita]|uniref:Uncharacterized protein n=1 Tax=Aquimarina addita TaxID=870485 RepID=A0ABP6UPK3_9FLAO
MRSSPRGFGIHYYDIKISFIVLWYVVETLPSYIGLMLKQKKWRGMFGLSLRNIYNRKNIIDQGLEFTDGVDDIILQAFDKRSLRLTPDVVIRFNF